MATCKLLGSEGIYNSDDGGNYVIYSKFTADATGKVIEIHVYSSANGHAKIAIYSDNSGEPGDKITGNDNSQAVTANQWNTLTIADTDIISGTVYWLGVAIETTGNSCKSASSGGVKRNKSIIYGTFSWPSSAGTGFSSSSSLSMIAGYGILMLSPVGISQPVSYGTPTVSIFGILISPQGISVIVSYGMPSLRYPQTISPLSIVQPVSIGTPWLGIFGFIKPQSAIQPVVIGLPTILKYVWHVILDGQYATVTPEVNRAYIIGRDQYGNPVYGTAVNTNEVTLLGERLDFQSDPAIPTAAQAGDVAAAVLSKMRLMGKNGVIFIPPNCGQELFDVVQISDSAANQSAVKFRIVGMRFEYNPGQAIYQHRLILGAP